MKHNFFFLLVTLLVYSCSPVNTNALKGLEDVKKLAVNHVSLTASYCSPNSIEEEVNSLIVIIIDDSGSNNIRRRNSKSYIGTDRLFNADGINSSFAIFNKEKNDRYKNLRNLLANQQDDRHSYALISFSNEASILANGSRSFFDNKSELVQKIDELIDNDLIRREGGTNYLDAFSKLESESDLQSDGGNQTQIAPVVTDYLQQKILNGTTVDSPYFISTYFFTDGAPIVDGSQIPYETINESVSNYTNNNEYEINGSLQTFERISKSFTSVFYTFPFFELTSDELALATDSNGMYIRNTALDSESEILERQLRDLSGVYGRGSFYKLDGTTDFSTIGIGNISVTYELSEPWLYNFSAAWYFDPVALQAKYEKDSDNDGIADKHELLIGCDPNESDTNGNGVRDGIEIHKRSATETCTLLPLSSPLRCNDIDPNIFDEDQDGLIICEERFLGSTDQNNDYNDNDIPDLIEALKGMPLSSDDSSKDYDDDGLLNYFEVYNNMPIHYDNSKYTQGVFSQDAQVSPIPSKDNRVCRQLNVPKLRVAADQESMLIGVWYYATERFAENKQLLRMTQQAVRSDIYTPQLIEQQWNVR